MTRRILWIDSGCSEETLLFWCESNETDASPGMACRCCVSNCLAAEGSSSPLFDEANICRLIEAVGLFADGKRGIRIRIWGKERRELLRNIPPPKPEIAYEASVEKLENNKVPCSP
jgi:hypothetical protein